MPKRKALNELQKLKEKVRKLEEEVSDVDCDTPMVEEYLEEEMLYSSEEEHQSEEKYQIKEEEDSDEVITITDEIDDDIIKLLGEDQPTGPPKGPPVLEEISKRWGNIMTSGTKLEDIVKKYPPPENLALASAPVLNKEIAAAVSEPVVTRDKKIAERQNQLGAAIAALASVITKQIKNKGEKELIQTLSDVGRILSDIYFKNSEIRQALILPLLDKGMKVLMKEVKVDEFLFGKELGEKIKEKKNIEKSALNLKSSSAKSKNGRGPTLPKNSYRQRPQNTGRQKYNKGHTTNPQRSQPRKHLDSASPQTQGRKYPVPHNRSHYSSRK